MRIPAAMSRNLALANPITMLVSPVCGEVAPVGWMKSRLMPIARLLVCPMFVTLDLRRFLLVRDPAPQFAPLSTLPVRGIVFAAIAL